MEIFNIGIGEFLLIAVIALLVFGPERLPEVLRQGTRFFSQVRGVGDEIQRQLLAETQPIRDTLEETRQEIEASARPIIDLQKEIGEAQQQLQDASRILPDRIYPGDYTSSPSPTASAGDSADESEVAAPADDAPIEVLDYKPVSRTEEADGHDPG